MLIGYIKILICNHPVNMSLSLGIIAHFKIKAGNN